jgi:hypothetical protein
MEALEAIAFRDLTMDEKEFSEAVERLKEVNKIVSELDPAIRSQAFVALSRYVSGTASDLSLHGLQGGDIMDMAFIVMMDAAKSARDDLNAVMEEVKAINAAKQDFRDLVCRMRKDLETLGEMGEMESLRLQLAMDRLSKLMSTLSNLLKKASETQQAITQKSSRRSISQGAT